VVPHPVEPRARSCRSSGGAATEADVEVGEAAGVDAATALQVNAAVVERTTAQTAKV